MQTRCPDCRTTLRIERPGTDPAATMTCTGCGATVRPGAFLCPRCEAGLQVDLAKLPAAGARGSCPACRKEIDVPALRTTAQSPAASRAKSPAPVHDEADAFDLGTVDADEETFDLGDVDEEASPADAGVEEGATRRLDLAALAEAAAGSEADADAGATLRLGAISPGGSVGTEDAGATRRLAPGTLSVPEAPPSDDDADTGSTRRLDLSKIELPRPEVPAPAPKKSPAAVAAPAPSRQPSTVAPKPIEPRTPERPRRTPSAVRSRTPAPSPPPKGRRAAPALLGLLLGALLLGGGAYGAMVADLWAPAPFPYEEMIPLVPMLARSVILGVAGALLGLLLGALLGGGRRR